jgi:UDP-N-acetylmuramoyl-L-alanyl-D-glutamate--2,6-diaminopimelate ligase
MKIKELLYDLKIKNISDSNLLDTEVSDITWEANNIKDNSICILYKGVNYDSHESIDKFYKTGKIRCFIVEKECDGYPYIRVDNSKIALALIAKNYFKIDIKDFSSIGITGTNGKTTISYLLENIYKIASKEVLKIGTVQYKVGNEIINANTTTPSSYEFYSLLSKAKSKNIKNVISEVSSHALSQYRVFGFIFDIAVFTNLTGDHLDYHSSMEDYFRAKRELFTRKYAKKAIINLDDLYGKRIYLSTKLEKSGYSFGVDGDIHVIKAEFSLNGIKAHLSIFDKPIYIESPLIGKHNLYNIMAAILAAHQLGFDIHTIIDGISSLDKIPGRLEKIEKDNIYYFIDYAHTDDALENVLQALIPFKKERIILVFGCGGNRDKTKRPRMARVAKRLADIIVVTNDNPRNEEPQGIIQNILNGIKNKNNVYVEMDRKKAICLANSLSREGDIILIAGKGHENYQLISGQKYFFDDKVVVQDILGESVEKHLC